MSSTKPKIVIYSDDETISKLDILAERNNRSRGNMAETIIKEYLNNNNCQLLESINLKNNKIG